ncbi:MAG: hypothetical protein ACYSUH_06840, partial [Planctomycetota bacterium]
MGHYCIDRSQEPLLIEQIDPVDFPRVLVLNDAHDRVVAVLAVVGMSKMADRSVGGPDRVHGKHAVRLPFDITHLLDLDLVNACPGTAAVFQLQR